MTSFIKTPYDVIISEIPVLVDSERCICRGLNLFLVQNFLNQFNFYVLLSCIHHHNLEQWQIKLKPVQKTLNQG